MAITEAASETSARLVVGVDIGGTFTDLYAFDRVNGQSRHAKSLTTPHDYSQGIWDCFVKADIATAGIEALIHGSTVAINIVIEEKGARTGLLVTRGTRDVYAIGRQNRPEAYNFLFKRPRPFVPRAHTYELSERMSAGGEVLTPLDVEEVRLALGELRQAGAESIAVCLLHSYANPEHEDSVGDVVAALAPDLFLALSHDIVREYREYERTSTTVVNAYVGPRMSVYIRRLEQRLHEESFAGTFLITQSNGGVMSPEVARARPVLTMESGPVSGVIAAAEVSTRIGAAHAVTFDMGGTTAKSALILDGQPEITHGYYVGGYASGHPIMLPVVDIIEVGAGGGSVAWIDDVGALKVGPTSAGADPGPIAYGLGGTEPTVTDANVTLGRIGAESFLGGDMPLDYDAAASGIERRLASQLNISTMEAAQGVIDIAVAKMSLAVRGVSVERGYDPRDFVMIACGGAGPLHAVEVARGLHIPTVVVPNLPAHFSALGMLLSDIRHDYVRTYFAELGAADLQRVGAIFAGLSSDATDTLSREGVATIDQEFLYSMDLRYVGQEFSLQTPIDLDQIRNGDRAGIKRAFDELHARRYGHSSENEQLEIVNVRVAAIGKREHVGPREAGSGSTESARVDARQIFLGHGVGSVSCPVYRRELLPGGAQVAGPAVIEEYASTTVISSMDSARVLETGEIVVTVGEE